MFSLKKIELTNFKIHKSFSLDISNKTDIFGKNAQGKTSILDALIFCLRGKKADMDKVHTEASEAVVTCTFIKNDEDNTPLIITRKINKQGVLGLKVTYDNKNVTDKPQTMIKDLVGFGTFNPKDLLLKEGRVERILKLLPLKVKKEDFEDFSLEADADSVDWKKHAFIVLEKVRDILHNRRHSLYQEKDLLLKGCEKNRNRLNERTFEAEKRFGDLKVMPKDLNEAIGKKSVLEEKRNKAIESEQNLKNEIEDLIKNNVAKKALLDSHNKDNEENKKKIEVLQEQINDLKGAVVNTNLEKIKIEEKIKNNDQDLTEKRAELEKSREFLKDFESKLSSAKEASDKAETIKSLSRDKESLAVDKKEALNKESEWKDLDTLIRVNFKNKRADLLKLLEEKVQGINIDSDHKITFNKIPIDELSESEAIRLGTILMNMDSKENIIAIDGAESVEKDSLNKMSIDSDKTIITLRVGDKPLGDDWESHEIKQ